MRRLRAGFWKSTLLTIAVLGLTAAAFAGGDKGSQGNPGIMPPNSHPYGLSYGQWGDLWWQKMLSIPAAINPILDETGQYGEIGQSGPVFILAGNFGGTTERTVVVPEDKGLLVPIVNYIWVNATNYGDPPWTEAWEAKVRADAKAFIDAATDLSCVIDGKAAKNIKAYRCQTPKHGAFMVDFPPGNLWGIEPGTYGPSITDGYYLMVEPLSLGEHTIRFTSSLPGGWHLDVTYHLMVAKKPHVFAPQSHPYGKSLAEWLTTYWRWFNEGADPAQSMVGKVQLMPMPAGEQLSGNWLPDDPAWLRGSLEVTLPAGTPFVLPAFAWIGERYDGYPGVPDDAPIANKVILDGVTPSLTIDGTTVLSDANKADYYVPPTYFDPIVQYPAPTSYGSVAAVFFQGDGMVVKALKPGVHVIRLYEPYILPAGTYPDWPGFGVIYDNTWIVTVTPPPKGHPDKGDPDEE